MLFRENSLFDTGKMSRSFLGPEIFFVPYLTLTSTFIPNLTLPSNPLANGVNWLLKRRFCPWKKTGEANLRGKKPTPASDACAQLQKKDQPASDACMQQRLCMRLGAKTSF